MKKPWILPVVLGGIIVVLAAIVKGLYEVRDTQPAYQIEEK